MVELILKRPIHEKIAASQAAIQDLFANDFVIMDAWSGGKDSSVTLSLILNAAREWVEEGHPTPTIIVTHGRTGIDNPVVEAYAFEEMARIEDFGRRHGVDVRVEVAEPAIGETYAYRTVGQGKLPVFPGDKRDCADAMKIKPQKRLRRHLLKDLKGLEADAEYDILGRARAWCWRKAGTTEYAEFRTEDLLAMLKQDLGYAVADDTDYWNYRYEIKAKIENGTYTILPAGYRTPGEVFILEAPADFRWVDLASGRDGDLLDPDYHHIETFRQAEAEGFEGVIIRDFCQTKVWGNVGHVSYGILAPGRDRIRVIGRFAATHFEWPEDDLSLNTTPEYEAWSSQQDVKPRRVSMGVRP